MDEVDQPRRLPPDGIIQIDHSDDSDDSDGPDDSDIEVDCGYDSRHHCDEIDSGRHIEADEPQHAAADEDTNDGEDDSAETFNGVMAVVDSARPITVQVPAGRHRFFAFVWRYINQQPSGHDSLTVSCNTQTGIRAYVKDANFFRFVQPTMYGQRMDRGTHLLAMATDGADTTYDISHAVGSGQVAIIAVAISARGGLRLSWAEAQLHERDTTPAAVAQFNQMFVLPAQAITIE
ncbi:hypothetical protein EBZ80_14875 [bacterium]|nr:hypothetical protein [bacterium]